MENLEMFDMHNHILFGVDDGAKDLEESLELIKIAYEDGIRGLILTPHFHPKRGMAHYKDIVENFNLLFDMAEQHFPEMQLFLGREVYYRTDIFEGEGNMNKFRMSDTDCVLIEFSTTVEADYVRKAVANVMFAGFQPIVAHVERYACAVKDKNLVKELKENGAYIQINADSILGKSGFSIKQATKFFLKNEYVDFVSSDAHDSKTRRPELKASYNYVAKKYGEEYANKLFRENAVSLLKGEL